MKKYNYTIRELKFVESYVSNGFFGSRAYAEAYQTTNMDVAKAEAYKMLKMPKIQDAISATEQSYRHLAREMKMDRKSILLKIKEVIQSDDAKTKLAGINTLCKILGDFAPEKQRVEIDYESKSSIDLSKLSVKEIEDMRNKFLASM